jgi:serine/threonine protein phosphatase PrpC
MRPLHTAYATYAAVQSTGTRTVQADAYAVLRDPVTGRIAAAVADGIGDSEESAWVAQVGADQAAEVAVRRGSAAHAVREARSRRNLHHLGYPDYDPEWDYWPGEGDAVLAVAVVQPGAAAVQIAWTGDCRVYRLGHTDVLEQITTDHTRGEQLRQLGFLDRDAPPCAADSVVTSRLACGPIGTALVPVELTRRLLLCSDGVGKQLDAAVIGLDLGTADHAAEAANWLAVDADVDGVDDQRTRSDNITAVVIDLSQRPTGRQW